jgi:hypothetical protein
MRFAIVQKNLNKSRPKPKAQGNWQFFPSGSFPKGNQASATAARGTNKKYAIDMDPTRLAGKR